VQSAIKEAYR